MSLIHALVARGSTVLAEHATSTGQFRQSAQVTILSKIPPNNSKLTYVWQDKLIHYVSSDGIVYLVVADDRCGRRTPFAFLGEVERRFTAAHPPSSLSTAAAHSLDDSFGPELARLMESYMGGGGAGSGEGSGGGDALRQARSDLDNVKDIMVQNIDSILARGERIELLVDKTDTMAGQAYAFRRGARGVRRQMWWKNTRITVLSGVVCVLLVYLFAAQFCGASLRSCRGS